MSIRSVLLKKKLWPRNP